MKMYFTDVSPYARKCLVVAHELGLLETIELLPGHPHPINRDQQIISDNPLGKVPTLLTDNGLAVHDSRVICEYLNSLVSGTLFPTSGNGRWVALSMQSMADGMLDSAVLARYEDVLRPVQLRWEQWRSGQLNKCETALAYLDAKPDLLRSQDVHIGTLSMACALWYLDLRFESFGWRDRYPIVADWYSTFSQRDSLQATWKLP